MTRLQISLRRLQRVTSNARVLQYHRRGSTLLVVVALMGMLSLLGVMFFAFATQEEENAKNFHEAAKVIYDPDEGPDKYFNWALKQLIIGPSEPQERNSALWGSHMSLLPNAYGFDIHPHSGQAIVPTQIASPSSGPLTGLSAPGIDLNRDGVLDTLTRDMDLDLNGIPDLLEINRSPSAHVYIPNPSNPSENQAVYLDDRMFPQPDMDYTYPDINNAFLAYHSWIVAVEDLNGNGMLDPGEPDLDGNGALSGPQRIRVVKPSFWRPELLQQVESGNTNEDANGDGFFDPATEDTNGNGFHDATDFNRDGSADGIAKLDPTWYWAPWSSSFVLRAHPEHYYIDPNPQVRPTVKRFLNDYDTTDQGIINGPLPGGSKGFPFSGRRDTTVAPLTDPQFPLKTGVWTAFGQSVVAHEFDVDADGDNIYEAILMDLSYPPEPRPSDGALYVPMFGITVYDADGLINLNSAGNLSGDTAPPTAAGATNSYFGNAFGTSGTGPFGSVSRSHSGISPFEINPLWALDAVPDSASPATNGRVDVVSNPDYAYYFGHNPTQLPNDLANRWELANMEFWWLNKGRIDVSGTVPRIISGRLGESSRNWAFVQAIANGASNVIGFNDPTASPATIPYFPLTGAWNRDDNRNAGLGGKGNANGAQTLAFQHPISFTGRGRFTVAGNPKVPELTQPTSGNPSAWLRYTGYDVAGVPEWANVAGGALMRDTRDGMLYHSFGPNGTRDGVSTTTDDYYVDDFLEMILETRDARRPTDDIFNYSDNAILQMSKSDIDNAGVSSRLDDLMPANINPSDNSTEANERRRRFTTSTWDRKQFGVSRPTGPGPDGRPGVGGRDDNRNGLIDDLGELGWPGSDDVRAWEFNVDSDQDGLPEFPPEFGGAPAYSSVPVNGEPIGLMPSTPQDPFRPEVRRLLEVEFGNRKTNDVRLQTKLSINGLLDTARNNASTGHPLSEPLEFRPLTPHPDATQAADVSSIPVITGGNQLPPLPPTAWNSSTQAEVQEFWARYDRQRLARDIYVLLYTFCGGWDGDNDGSFPDNPLASNSSNQVYSDSQMREMAQFAVNMVDAMDRDSVMTVFEYDDDLSDGWNLDDQVATNEGGDRAIVAGVEAQQLTISESLWVFQPKLANDNAYTPFDETMPPTATGPGAEGYHFMQIELRNASPESVGLAVSGQSTGNGEDSIWRLRWQDTTDAANIQRIEAQNNNITNGNGIFFKAYGSSNNTIDSVNAGGLFTVATSNNINPDSSDLFVNYNTDADYELIAPYGGVLTPDVSGSNPTNVTPNTNLDLVQSVANTQNQNRFVLANGATGDFVSQNYDASQANAFLVLERRANPDLPNLSVTENPWVTVDYSQVFRRRFMADTGSAPTQTDTVDELDRLKSRQRREPLTGFDEQDFNDSIDSIRTNSLMSNNRFSTAVTQFTVVQSHFDRDFTSAVELLSLPLQGPKFQTRAVGRMKRSIDNQISDSNGPYNASARILRPIHPSDSAQNNHWHRLLGFVEAPSQVHQQLGRAVDAIVRIPGRINLNTIRHPESLAALLDDPQLFTPPERDIDGDGVATAGLEDHNGNGVLDYGLPGFNLNDATRDWWQELLRSRDGVDLTTGLSLPGMPRVVVTGSDVQVSGARPFRDLGYVQDISGAANIGGNIPNPESPVEDTVLRSHPGFFPAGTDPRFNSPVPPSTRGLFDLGTAGEVNGNNLHGFIQRRILSKIAGNTTSRSNVFFVFISVQFHEAYRDTSTNAVRIGGRIDLNEDGTRDDGHRGFFVIDRSLAEEAYDSRTETFDWQPLVKHRITIN